MIRGPEDLGRELAAHPRWEWREGMLDNQGHRDGGASPGVEIWPDLADPATAGVLLGMLEHATGMQPTLDMWTEYMDVETAEHEDGSKEIRTVPIHRGVCVGVARLGPPPYTATGYGLGRGRTLGEACARALLEAWGPYNDADAPLMGAGASAWSQ